MSVPDADRLETQIGQARRLRTNGYLPIPVLRHDAPLTIKKNGEVKAQAPGKQPHGMWARKEQTVYAATDAMIADWRRLKGITDYQNTGIACGSVAASDIDIH